MQHLKLIDSKQLAAILGVTAKTVRRWRTNQILPEPLVCESKCFWSLPQIEKWIQSGAILSQNELKRDI